MKHKLQMMPSNTGRQIYFIYLPKKLIERFGWQRGYRLIIKPEYDTKRIILSCVEDIR